MATTDQFVGLHAQMHEIMKRVGNGSLDSDDVKVGLQAIIEKRELLTALPATSQQTQVSSWYVSPGVQLERVKRLNYERGWRFDPEDFPPVPEFVPSPTSTEVLLLVVYLPERGRQPGLHRTFDELWDLLRVPAGYAKWRWEGLKATTKLLQQASDYDYVPGIRWVVFNPNAYQGKSPEQALRLAKSDGLMLAGLEVLMAALLFPDWVTSWNGTSSPYPWLSGLQVRSSADWSNVPYLDRWDDYRKVYFSADWADYVSSEFGSPSFREC